tara:strand:- start:64 stop:342 length:279 start_codon:yes stop_codon:yes gene_type:complete
MNRKRIVKIERGDLLGEFQTDSGQALIRANDVSAVVALTGAIVGFEDGKYCDIHMVSGTIFTVSSSLHNVLQMLQLDVCCVFEDEPDEEGDE